MESENYDSSFICDHYSTCVVSHRCPPICVRNDCISTFCECLSLLDGIADLAGIFVGNTLGAFIEFFVVDLVGAS